MTTRFIELAGEINTAMPAYVVSRTADALNEHSKPLKGSKILLLGMSYKKDVDDSRESPGLELLELFSQKGAIVQYNDPYIPRLPRTRRHPDLALESQPLTAEYLGAQDCVVIVTDHSAYDWEAIVKHAPLVVDTRNAMKAIKGRAGKVIRA
jgi:UDP-N-acetyl-D-glucosamine dehydrogenase